jgi:hypothetical protein
MSTIRRSSFTPSDCQARADSYGRRREVSPIRSLQSRTIFCCLATRRSAISSAVRLFHYRAFGHHAVDEFLTRRIKLI